LRNSALSEHISIEPIDNQRLANLCGQSNEHIHQIESFFEVTITQRSNEFNIIGKPNAVRAARNIIHVLYQETERDKILTPEKVHLILQSKQNNHQANAMDIIQTKQCKIKPRGTNQQQFIQRIHENALNFAVGPAGTGKTYLAVACAVEAFDKNQIKRIILARPAVEAGEKLGFLPGDLAQKVDPYLKPLYDALYEMMGAEQVDKLLDKNIIEILPLAFMRGRTLNDSFIILDEAQNATTSQMKMFLTRIGFGSTAVVTGDVTQIDLQKHSHSGLIQALDILQGLKGISFTHFTSEDTVRHELVQSIINAYEKVDDKKS